MVDIAIGKWYYSKRGHLCRADDRLDDGTYVVTSHYTGNRISVSENEASFFKEAEEPATSPGTAIALQVASKTKNEDFDHLYEKYTNIVPGSIYKVQTTANKKRDDFVKVEGKMRVKKGMMLAKGSTRCKIFCIICGKERDIKVQEAFQVKYCEECKGIQKKKNLKKFLDKKHGKKTK